MARYQGILYKLKSILPQAVRLSIFHSFIQSHLNYCSLIWGFASKSNIELLFRAQKKGIRAVMPRYVNFFYKYGVNPASTKSTFAKLKILTVHGLIVKNALIFMYKVHHFAMEIPSSIRDTIPDNSPIAGSSYETCAEWLSEHNTSKQRNSVYFKGPLLYAEFSATNQEWNSCTSITTLKSAIKRKLREIQSTGDPVEWQANNFKLYDICGLRKSERNC